MIKKLYIVTCIVLSIAGLSFAAISWMQRYALQEPPAMANAPVSNGVLVVDPDNLPELYPVGDFSFTNKDNSTFSQDSVTGKVWVGYLFFSTCPSQCPMMTSNLRPVTDHFANDERVHFAGFSVDPETDTTEQLTKYAMQYKATNPRWHFLTAPKENVQKLAVDGFRLGSVDDPQFHSDKMVLVDQAGTIRGYFSGIDTAEVAQLQTAIQRLLDESTPPAS
jgi:cytochrome oxidase Cu insertion factor (SCO1/SenC/PrrC family)